jgi:hypothetical protein
MISPGQLGQASKDSNRPPQEAHESPLHTRRRPTGRFSLPRNKWTWLGIIKWIWLGIMLSVIALVGVTLAVGGRSHQATSDGRSAATGGAPAAPGSITASQGPNSSKAKGKVPTAARVAESGGALSLPTSMQGRVIAWQDGTGGKYLAAVTRLFGDALQAGGARQYSQMRSACIQLTGSVSTAEAGPQIPVAAMQILYGKALAELAKGAADCQAAIAIKPTGDAETVGFVVNAAERQKAASELATGAKDIFRSTAEIEITSRQSH